jgi:hypothetical protein
LIIDGLGERVNMGGILRCNGGWEFGFGENFVLGPSGGRPGLFQNKLRVWVAITLTNMSFL